MHEFDGTEKYTAGDTVYYLKDGTDFATVNAELEGGNWKPDWDSGHKSFRIDMGFKVDTTVEGAIDDVEKEFRGYTILG